MPSGADQTEQVRALEAALAEEQAAHAQTRQALARAVALLEHAPLAICVKDPESRYLLVNRQFERLAQRPRALILGRVDAEVFPADVARAMREHEAEVRLAGRAVEQRETVTMPDGPHTFLVARFPTPAGTDGRSGVAAVCTEITALEAAREQLRRTHQAGAAKDQSEALGEFSAALVRSFSGPLLELAAGVADLQRQVMLHAELAEPTARAADGVQRLIATVADMEGLVRPLHPVPLPVEVAEVLAGAAAQARSATGQEVPVLEEVAPGLREVTVDASMVQAALASLIANAAVATGRTGPVRVRASRAPGRLVLDVVDDGEGIPPGLQARIFEPFFTTRPSASGLGLPIALRLVEAHRGTLTHEPTPGGGATFRISLPQFDESGV